MFRLKQTIKLIFIKKILQKKFENIVFSKLPIPIVLLNKNSKILFANNCFYSTFQILPKFNKTENITSLFREITTDYLNNKKIYQTEFNLNNKWYKVIKINCNRKILLHFYDITTDKLTEEKRSTFIASLTHDLKTPINAQSRALELLLKGSFGQLTNEQTEIIEEIKKSCNYMHNLIFNIVDTYLFDRGKRKLIREKFDLSELVNQTLNEISYLLDEKQQTMNIKSSFEACEIFADKFQMKRALTNLISNAISHGNPHSEIEIDMKQNQETISFDIKNQSAMKLPENLENIFSKFQTNLSAGSGLGLYIVKQIINSEGGSVHAQNTHDGNCIFGFETPKKLDLLAPLSNYLKK